MKQMKKQTFSYQSLAAALIIVVFGLSLGFYIPNEPNMEVRAQSTSCEIGDFTTNTEVLCWAADAASFVMDNELFSILNPEDLRDAVKHYRFYQLMASELN